MFDISLQSDSDYQYLSRCERRELFACTVRVRLAKHYHYEGANC